MKQIDGKLSSRIKTSFCSINLLLSETINVHGGYYYKANGQYICHYFHNYELPFYLLNHIFYIVL